MDYERIFYQNEEQYKTLNEKKIQIFIALFLKHSQLNFSISDLYDIYEMEENNYYDIFGALRDYIYSYYPNYVPLFYQLLEHCGYNNSFNITDNMYILGYGTNKKISERWITSSISS